MLPTISLTSRTFRSPAWICKVAFFLQILQSNITKNTSAYGFNFYYPNCQRYLPCPFLPLVASFACLLSLLSFLITYFHKHSVSTRDTPHDHFVPFTIVYFQRKAETSRPTLWASNYLFSHHSVLQKIISTQKLFVPLITSRFSIVTVNHDRVSVV